MAKKKTAKRRRRSSKVRHLSAGPRRRRSSKPTRRRRSSRRRTGLSAAFTHAGIMSAAKTMLGGAGGGLAAGVAHKVMGSMPPLARIGIQMAISYATTAVVGWPNIGAGYAGGATALESQEVTDKLLSEAGIMTGRYADSNAANQLPLVLNDNGQMLNLCEDENGTYVYLNENTGDAYLAESIYPEYMPRYNNA